MIKDRCSRAAAVGAGVAAGRMPLRSIKVIRAVCFFKAPAGRCQDSLEAISKPYLRVWR